MYKDDNGSVWFKDAWGSWSEGYSSLQEAVEALKEELKKYGDDIPEHVSLAIGDDKEGNRWYAIDSDPMRLSSVAWTDVEAMLKDEREILWLPDCFFEREDDEEDGED